MKKYVIIGVILSVLGVLWLLMKPVTIKTTEVEIISVTGTNIHDPYFRLPLPLLRPPLVTEGIIFKHFDYRQPSYDFSSFFGFEQEISLTEVQLLDAVFLSDTDERIHDITELMDEDTPPTKLYVEPNKYLHNVFSKTFGIQVVPSEQWFTFSWNAYPITLGINTLNLKGAYCVASGCTDFSSKITFRLYEKTRYSTEVFERMIGI